LATPGGGIEGEVLNKRIIVGNRKDFCRARGVEVFRRRVFSHIRKNEHRTMRPPLPFYIGINGRTEGVFLLTDRIKSSAVEALKQLRAEGLRIVMLKLATGERRP